MNVLDQPLEGIDSRPGGCPVFGATLEPIAQAYGLWDGADNARPEYLQPLADAVGLLHNQQQGRRASALCSMADRWACQGLVLAQKGALAFAIERNPHSRAAYERAMASMRALAGKPCAPGEQGFVQFAFYQAVGLGVYNAYQARSELQRGSFIDAGRLAAEAATDIAGACAVVAWFNDQPDIKAVGLAPSKRVGNTPRKMGRGTNERRRVLRSLILELELMAKAERGDWISVVSK